MLMMIIKVLQINNDKPYHILPDNQLIPLMTQKIWIFVTAISTSYCNALFLLPFTLLCIVISSYFIISRKRIIKNNNDHDECNNENRNKIDDDNNDNHNEDVRRRKRKEQFLQSCHNAKLEYGYQSSPKGYIDLWRKKEFPTLIRPLLLKSNEVSNNNNKESSVVSAVRVDPNNNNNTKYSHDHELEVYLDYAGSSLPSLTLLNNIHELSIKKQIMANPHSSGIAASRSMEMIEIVKKKVLQFFDAEPGPLNYTIPCKDYGTSKDHNNVSDYHPGYDVIFTSGATESLRIIGEYFQWKDTSTSNKTMVDNRKSLFVYPQSVHTSVIGIRELALAKGASFMCETNANIFGANIETFRRWEEFCSDGCSSNQNSNVECNKEDIVNNLLVLPLECNFGGMRFDNAKTIIELSRKETDDPKSSCYKWYTMLDIAKAACTQSIHLREIDPDFACVSFYKIFGEPTGLGALLVKRSSKHVITSRHTETVSLDEKTRHYFGGGAVDVVLPGIDFVFPRSNISSLTHGTINFRGIMSLIPCFDEIESFGGMRKISSHTRCLSVEAVKRLNALRHENDKKAIVIYGTWPNYVYNENSSSFIPLDQLPGPTITFNVIRHDGSFVGYNEVSKLAALYKTPIQLRTGCFCNTGACQEALGLNDEMVKQNYLEGGHVCGDEIDIINNKPTGAVRVSFGKDSIWEDLDSLIEFLESTFCSNSYMEKGHITPLLPHRATDVLLSEIYVYPIKSCSAMKVTTWNMNRKTGALKYDREFALVDSSGSALRLNTYPKMGLIKPWIDLKAETLVVKAEGFPDLVINLESDNNTNTLTKEVKVCGSSKCRGIVWGSHAVSQWFSSFLEVQCWLARAYSDEFEDNNSVIDHKTRMSPPLNHINESQRGFENESPILLITKSSVDLLNIVMQSQGSKPVDSRYFRPNFVVTGKIHDNSEDLWTKVLIPRHCLTLSVTGPCARCAMVDIDPDSGTKGGKTLRALAEYRRDKGRINFGVFLSSKNDKSMENEISITQGELLIVS